MAPVPTARDYLITPNKMEVVHLSRMAKSGSSRALNKIASKSDDVMQNEHLQRHRQGLDIEFAQRKMNITCV